MKMPITNAVTGGLTMMVAATSMAQAQGTAAAGAKPAAAQPPPASSVEQWIKDVKTPASWFTWGADFRARNEYYNNIATLSDDVVRHEQDVIRYRGRVWASAAPVEGLSINSRLTAEPRQWMKPSFAGAYRGESGMEWRYGIFDNLNVKYTNAFNQPLSITAGRQDIFIGDYLQWWLVADGTPSDGSWTFFLDSVRVNYDIPEINTKLDVIGIYQSARPDEWMPTINRHQDAYSLTEQNEAGAIVYASNRSIKNTTLDAFFIYKGDEQEFANGDNADIYTFGGRVAGKITDHWLYSAEGAYQFGEKQDPTVSYRPGLGNQWRDIDAFGANARLTYAFKDPLNNQLQVVYEFLSGDDPSTTGSDEMFDILWGRWPRWSELYIYSYIAETGGKIAQLNNVQRAGLVWTLNPLKKLSMSTGYNALLANEETPTRALTTTVFSQDGNFRGHLVQSVFKYQFNQHLNAHLWSEFVWQGDYYAQRDLMTFVRAELLVTF